MLKCRVCNSNIVNSFDSSIIFDIEVKYYDCDVCGYIQTENPTWLEKAYELPINITDTGIMQRNKSNLSLTLSVLWMLGNKHSRVVDFAGGYGILVRMLRDVGVDAYWLDLYCTNLIANGFEYNYDSGRVSLITAFEVFEHFVNPANEIDDLLKIAPNILLTTTIVPKKRPNLNEWWYYGTEHGQHVGLYRVKTLSYLASKYEKYFVSDGISTHLFTEEKVPQKLFFVVTKISRLSMIPFMFGIKSKTWTDHINLTKTSKTSRS